MKRNTRVGTGVKWIFRIVFLIIFVYQTIVYLEYDRIIESDSPIHYTYIDKEITGARSNSHQMAVEYNGRKYTVHITSRINELIDGNKFPDLYYSSRLDAVFSLWGRTKAMRIALVCMAGALVTVIPFHRLVEKLEKRLVKPSVRTQ